MDLITYEVFVPEKSEQDPIITPSITTYSPPICLDDGTILTQFHAGFDDNGKTPNSDLSLNPTASATAIITCSFIQRMATVVAYNEKIFVAISTVASTIYYSTNKGDTWSNDSLAVGVSAKSMYVIGDTMHFFDYNNSQIRYYTHTVGSSGATLKSGFAETSKSYFCNPIRYGKYLVLVYNNKIYGFEIGTSNYVAFGTIPDSLQVFSNRSHSAMVLGKFPHIYIPLSSDGSSSTDNIKYLYKLTEYGTTTNSWVFKEYRILPRYTLLSQSLDEYSYISHNDGGDYRIWRLDHITGTVYAVYKSDDPIEFICPTQIPSTPFVLSDSGSQWYKHFPIDLSENLNICKSYHYINAISSSGEIEFPKTMLAQFDKVNKCGTDFYTKSHKYNPAYFDFRDEEVDTTNPTITDVSVSGYTSYIVKSGFYNHSNVLWLYEDEGVGVADGVADFDIMPTGTTTFTHGTISFFFGGIGNFDSTVIDHIIDFVDNSDVSKLDLRFYTKINGISYYDMAGSTTSIIGEELNYYEIDFDGRVGGGYKGLTQYCVNVRINGITYEANYAVESSAFSLQAIKLKGSVSNPSAEKYCHYFDAVTCTGRGEHPLKNYTKGDLGFRGYLENIDWTDYIIKASFVGIDKELSANSTSISVLYRNSKDLMIDIVDSSMKQISQYQSIDPNGNYDTDRVIDYGSTNYAIIIDELNDLEDGLEYREPDGRIWMRKITDIFDTTKVISTTSDIKIIQCDWGLGTSSDVNRVVVYGSKYSDADGVIRQVVGVDEDEVSVSMDGIHEAIYRRSSCKTIEQANEVAANIRKRFGSLLTNPYKLINVVLKTDWFQVGSQLSFEYDVKDVEVADRIILSQEYDYRSEWTTIQICETIIQDEDATRMQELIDTQRDFTNEFIDTDAEYTPYESTDQIIFKNSITSLQTGIITATPIIIDNSNNYKVAPGVLGKEWEFEVEISEYPNWIENSVTTIIETKDGHVKALKITCTASITDTSIEIVPTADVSHTNFTPYTYANVDEGSGGPDSNAIGSDPTGPGNDQFEIQDPSLLNHPTFTKVEFFINCRKVDTVTLTGNPEGLAGASTPKTYPVTTSQAWHDNNWTGSWTLSEIQAMEFLIEATWTSNSGVSIWTIYCDAYYTQPNPGYVRNTLGDRASGEIDFWIYKADDKLARIKLQDSGSSDLLTIEIHDYETSIDGNIIYNWDLGVWTHIRIEFINGSDSIIYIGGSKIYQGNALSSNAYYLKFESYTGGEFWIDAISYSWLGYRPYMNYGAGVLACKEIVDHDKPRGHWLHFINRTDPDSGFVDYLLADFNFGTNTELDISEKVPPEAVAIYAVIWVQGGSIIFLTPRGGTGEGVAVYTGTADDETKAFIIQIKDQKLEYAALPGYPTKFSMTILGYFD